MSRSGGSDPHASAVVLAVLAVTALAAVAAGLTDARLNDSPLEGDSAAIEGPSRRRFAVNRRYWGTVERKIRRSPGGLIVALAAHNCYEQSLRTPAGNLEATLAKIHEAQEAGADLIEIDVLDDGDDTIRIAHDSERAAFGSALSDVLDDDRLRAGNQLLFIELKEQTPTRAHIVALLDLVASRGYARKGRPVILRARVHLDPERELDRVQTVLESGEFAQLRPHVRLHGLFIPGRAPRELRRLIRRAARRGYDGIELSVQNSELFPSLALAHDLGLAVAVYTLSGGNGEIALANLRSEVDIFSADGELRAWRRRMSSPSDAFTLDLGSQRRELNFDEDHDRLELEPVQLGNWLGVLLTTVIDFDSVDVPDGGSVGIVTAGDGPDPPFGLELYAPSGADVKLRFWVRVEGSTHSAECSAVQFLQGQSYLITGAYDGNGRVRLWIDHGVRGVAPSRALRGPIEPAGDPLILGARPAISGRPAIPAFRGRIRHLMVRGWGPRES